MVLMIFISVISKEAWIMSESLTLKLNGFFRQIFGKPETGKSGKALHPFWVIVQKEIGDHV